MPIRVLLVESDLKWVNIVTALINKDDDILLVGNTSSCRNMPVLAKALEADIVLIDPAVDEENEYELETAAQLAGTKTRLIVYSSLFNLDEILGAYASGALYVLHKKQIASLTYVLKACMSCLQSLEAVLGDYRRLRREEALRPLTAAERVIYDYTESGLGVKDISVRLFRSERTIKNQVNSMLRKLDATNCREAVMKVNSYCAQGRGARY